MITITPLQLPPLLWEKAQFIFILVLIFFIYCFQMIFLFPQLVKVMNAGLIQQYVHIFLATMLLMNICGNMMMSAGTDLKIRVMLGEVRYCDLCNEERPAASWHCKKCSICVMRRDHHCSFLGKCIGLNNKRYYLLFLAHVTLAMIYATIYNYFFVAALYDGEFALIYIIRLINPMVQFALMETITLRDLYAVYLMLGIIIIVWAGSLFFFHFRNSAMGVTGYENKHNPKLQNMDKWKENLIAVFGIRWYWAIVCPFIISPLPRYVRY